MQLSLLSSFKTFLSSSQKNPPAGDTGSIPELGRSPGEKNGNPLQYSYLENPMDRGAWWATVRGVAKSPTRLDVHSTQLKEILYQSSSYSTFLPPPAPVKHSSTLSLHRFASSRHLMQMKNEILQHMTFVSGFFH